MRNILTDIVTSQKIFATDKLFNDITKIQIENDLLLSRLNNEFHKKNEKNEILSLIFGEIIKNSVEILLPFYTDFGRNIHLGENVFINREAMFVDLGGIILEDDVLIGPRVSLITVNHLESPIERRGIIASPILIKKGAWIGANATILPGVTIGENAIVAANATVTKDIPANLIVAGTPAKMIRSINN